MPLTAYINKYDELDSLIKTTGQQSQKNSDHDYYYDSLGNLVYEKNGNGANKGNEYWYNSLNQQVNEGSGQPRYVYLQL